jgi:hypothetical protein
VRCGGMYDADALQVFNRRSRGGIYWYRGGGGRAAGGVVAVVRGAAAVVDGRGGLQFLVVGGDRRAGIPRTDSRAGFSAPPTPAGTHSLRKPALGR